MEDEYKDLEEGEMKEVRDMDAPQVEPKVKVKRNRGLKKDIKNLLSVNPVISPKEVFETLKSNSYGGALPISLNTVMSTMSQIKKKVSSPDLKEDVGKVNTDKDLQTPFDASDGQDIVKVKND